MTTDELKPSDRLYPIPLCRAVPSHLHPVRALQVKFSPSGWGTSPLTSADAQLEAFQHIRDSRIKAAYGAH